MSLNTFLLSSSPLICHPLRESNPPTVCFFSQSRSLKASGTSAIETPLPWQTKELEGVVVGIQDLFFQKSNIPWLVVEPTHLKKICSSNWVHLPRNIRGENEEYLSCHQLVYFSTKIQHTPRPLLRPGNLETFQLWGYQRGPAPDPSNPKEREHDKVRLSIHGYPWQHIDGNFWANFIEF